MEFKMFLRLFASIRRKLFRLSAHRKQNKKPKQKSSEKPTKANVRSNEHLNESANKRQKRPGTQKINEKTC